MSLEAPALVGLVVIVAFAFTVEAALGFGSTLVTVSLGVLFVPLDQLLPAFVPLNVVLSSVIVARHHRDLDRRLLFLWVLPLMALGLPLGWWAFQNLDRTLSLRTLGVVVGTLALLQLYRQRDGGRPRKVLPRGPAALLLVMAGVVHGAFATGGPLVVYVLGQQQNKSNFRVTLSALWLILNLVLIGGYLTAGQLTSTTLQLSLPLALGLAFGLIAGERLFRSVPEPQFRVGVYALLLLAAILMFFRA
ncbi:MAG: sulfite exporter TauE/SafE family protein [Deltaproteobacteria bacterium]|nr:sulfite exporter TauE/SafE family protein [Deltaproteobacteria bacterium]